MPLQEPPYVTSVVGNSRISNIYLIIVEFKITLRDVKGNNTLSTADRKTRVSQQIKNNTQNNRTSHTAHTPTHAEPSKGIHVWFRPH